MLLAWLAKKRILAQLGISPERAGILRVRMLRRGGVNFVVRAIAPTDFLGYDTHPMAPWREAKDKVSDIEAAKAIERELSDPARAKAAAERMAEPIRRILLKAVLWPRLSEKDEPGTVCVDDLVADPQLTNELVGLIGETSLGKKKA